MTLILPQLVPNSKKFVLESPNDYLKIIEEMKKFKVVKTPVLDFENCFNNHKRKFC